MLLAGLLKNSEQILIQNVFGGVLLAQHKEEVIRHWLWTGICCGFLTIIEDSLHFRNSSCYNLLYYSLGGSTTLVEV